MKATSRLTKPAEQWLLHVLATVIVGGSLLFSGVIQHGGAKDIDARYFYVAARCWASGQSPYEATVYDNAFRAVFGSHPDALFVAYPPTLMPVVLPMAPFRWPVAAALFSWMNFAAAMALYWACYRMVRASVGSPLQVHQWFWVVLASTIGGIGGTIFTGQSSVFITAACALAIAGCRLNNKGWIVAGLVVASAKPHISGPLILFILLFERKQWRAIAIAGGVAALLVAYAAAVDANLLHSYLGSIHTYNTLSVNDPAKLLGATSLLLHLGVSLAVAQWVGLLGLLLVLLLTGWVLYRSHAPLSRVPVALMLLTFSIGLARGVQGYDLCCYALGMALVATLNVPFRWVLLLPSLMVWRPGVFAKAFPLVSGGQLASFAWLWLLVGTVLVAALEIRRYSAQGSSTLVADPGLEYCEAK